MKTLPLYELQLDLNDIEGTGLLAVSLVSNPATQRTFLKFASEKMEFAVGNNERRIIVGPVLIPEQIIYRRRPSDNFEFNVKFNSDQVEAIVQRFHKGNSSKVTLEHALSFTGAEIQSLWLSDSELGISAPDGFKDLPNKTLFASYKITDDGVWSDIKAGVFTGFSLEGFFNMFPINLKKHKTDLELFKEISKECDDLFSVIAI